MISCLNRFWDTGISGISCTTTAATLFTAAIGRQGAPSVSLKIAQLRHNINKKINI